MAACTSTKTTFLSEVISILFLHFYLCSLTPSRMNNICSAWVLLSRLSVTLISESRSWTASGSYFYVLKRTLSLENNVGIGFAMAGLSFFLQMLSRGCPFFFKLFSAVGNFEIDPSFLCL